MYVMKLKGGREISGVKQNGPIFSTTEAITLGELETGVRHIMITGKPDLEDDVDRSGEYVGMRVEFYEDLGERREFVLGMPSEAEVEAERTRADIEYLAMKAGVEL